MESNETDSKKKRLLTIEQEAQMKEKKRKLDLKYKGIETDQIKTTNFIPLMRYKLLTNPENRTPRDIKILKKCTSFLSFFKNIMRVDPDDRRKAHENGCRLLRYRTQKKGSLVTKYKTASNEFYITLKGDIGVLIPRDPEKIQKELDSVYWVRKRLGFGIDLTRRELEELSDGIGSGHVQNKNIKKWDRILERENRVVYREEYLKKNLGGLCLDDVPEEADLFSKDHVENCFTQRISHNNFFPFEFFFTYFLA